MLQTRRASAVISKNFGTRVELTWWASFFDKDLMNFGQRHQDGHALVKHIVCLCRAAFPDLRFSVDVMVGEATWLYVE